MNQGFEEIEYRLKKIEDMVVENNNMLQSIQRRARMTIIVSLLKWFIILGFSFGLFYFTKPYLEKTLDIYTQVSGLTSSIENQKDKTTGILQDIRSLIE